MCTLHLDQKTLEGGDMVANSVHEATESSSFKVRRNWVCLLEASMYGFSRYWIPHGVIEYKLYIFQSL